MNVDFLGNSLVVERTFFIRIMRKCQETESFRQTPRENY
jgi:hypothetical protein